ncbi:MAG TPA: hypothetical protein VMS31_11530 [Pyrinomonadaceae bacterium]|nr:hypothetical protein [Pyrinomonadaceae bacterium]
MPAIQPEQPIIRAHNLIVDLLMLALKYSTSVWVFDYLLNRKKFVYLRLGKGLHADRMLLCALSTVNGKHDWKAELFSVLVS